MRGLLGLLRGVQGLSLLRLVARDHRGEGRGAPQLRPRVRQEGGGRGRRRRGRVTATGLGWGEDEVEGPLLLQRAEAGRAALSPEARLRRRQRRRLLCSRTKLSDDPFNVRVWRGLTF